MLKVDKIVNYTYKNGADEAYTVKCSMNGAYSSVMNIFGTCNCQMVVLSGIEGIFEIIRFEKNTRESLRLLFEKILKQESKPLCLMDVSPEVRDWLLLRCNKDNIVMNKSFKSTNGHTRCILVLNMINLIK